MQLRPFVRRHVHVYYSIYYWFRVVFIHLVPCVALIVLNVLLVGAMRGLRARRRALMHKKTLPTSKPSHNGGGGLGRSTADLCRRLAERNLTTMMLVAVVGCMLVVELPLAALFIVVIAQYSLGIRLVDDTHARVASVFLNLFILLSYPINFFIYCGMSAQFRATFVRMVFFCHRKRGVGGARGVSEAGSRSCTGAGGGGGGGVGDDGDVLRAPTSQSGIGGGKAVLDACARETTTIVLAGGGGTTVFFADITSTNKTTTTTTAAFVDRIEMQHIGAQC